MHKREACESLPLQYNLIQHTSPSQVAEDLFGIFPHASWTHLRQQVQPRAQLDLTPHERAQIADAQRILQSTLDARLVVILALRSILGVARSRRSFGFPSADSLEEVFADFNVRRRGGGVARRELGDVGLDLGDLLGEGLY